MTNGEAPHRRYAKPVVVPSRLELLQGPTSGLIRLPRHLKWSGSPEYDLDEPGRTMDLYRAVINEAATPTDLHTYLDRDTLIRLWDEMWLPVAVRQEWENRFPELTHRRTTAA
jgi:hypothetical protein